MKYMEKWPWAREPAGHVENATGTFTYTPNTIGTPHSSIGKLLFYDVVVSSHRGWDLYAIKNCKICISFVQIFKTIYFSFYITLHIFTYKSETNEVITNKWLFIIHYD